MIELNVTDTATWRRCRTGSGVRRRARRGDCTRSRTGHRPHGGGFLDDVGGREYGGPVSTYSYKALAMAALPLMSRGGALVGLTHASVSWPAYGWMKCGEGRAESTSVTWRYLGPRASAATSCPPARSGPWRRSPSGFGSRTSGFGDSAGLGLANTEPAARACLALLSDGSQPGEIVHVDGGYHAMGA